MLELLPIVYLSVASFFAWVVSTLAGGGSPFILIPLVNLLMGAAAVPPVITIGMFFGNAHRVFLFWREIDWVLTAWYAPGAIADEIAATSPFHPRLKNVIALFKENDQFKQTRGLIELVSRLLRSVWERSHNDVFLIDPQHFDLSIPDFLACLGCMPDD